MDNQLARMLQQAQGGGGMGGGGAEAPIMDTAETIQISSLALLKMLKHGEPHPRQALWGLARATAGTVPTCPVPCKRVSSAICARCTPLLACSRQHSAAGRAGVPMEVMGLMLGSFVDDFTVKVVDVFAMPQSGTGVSVEAVDPVFQVPCTFRLQSRIVASTVGSRLLTAHNACLPCRRCK